MTYVKETNLNWNVSFGINNGHNNTTMTENRKRSREDDTCEFMPLSKRINNLHINNVADRLGSPNLQEHLEHASARTESINLGQDRTTYDPGFSSSQSQYYFDNKLLFELHLERIQRSNQSFPF